jgi:hypothetical protein
MFIAIFPYLEAVSSVLLVDYIKMEWVGHVGFMGKCRLKFDWKI